MIELSSYNFVVMKGTAKKSGKFYRKAVLDTALAFDGSFVDRLITEGAKVIDLDNLKRKK